MSKCRYCKLCEWANDGDKDFFGWCELHLDSYDIDEPRDCPDYIRASNADRIRAMSDEELAKYLSNPCDCEVDPERDGFRECGNDLCVKYLLEWLQQPAEEETP